MLAFTPPEQFLDRLGRPYFLWDTDQDDAEFRAILADPDPGVRAYALGKLMRQAKPDDVFRYVDLDMIEAHWEQVQPFLGRRRDFWTWILPRWLALRRG